MCVCGKAFHRPAPGPLPYKNGAKVKKIMNIPLYLLQINFKGAFLI